MSPVYGSERTSKVFLPPGALAISYGLVVLIVLIFADQVSMRYGLAGPQRVADDACGAIIAGVLVYGYERRRSKALARRLRTIELMNHHVRNALQTITYSVYMRAQLQQVTEIKDAVQRIDWALREILPGHSLDADEDASRRPPARQPDEQQDAGRSRSSAV
jgi:hypothetical protein